MVNIDLIFVSLLSGVWNVLRDLTNSAKHKISVFILGFVFCYGSALIAEFYGFSSEISAFIGYVCGVLSNQIYDSLARIVNEAPKILEKKIDNDK